MSALSFREGDSEHDGLDPIALLLRQFAVELLAGHNLKTAIQIMAPDYSLNVGGHTLSGRDDGYLPAVSAQLAQFPGLSVTVHDILISDTAGALRFSEHGASRRHQGQCAAWGGVVLFRTNGRQLQTGWTEEDYFARKRQLSSGICDPIEAPHPAPWDTRACGPDTDTEAVAHSWLSAPWVATDLPDTTLSSPDPAASALVEVAETHIVELISAGPRAAFYLEHRGQYAGGYADLDTALIGTPVTLRAAGLLTVDAGEVVAARVTTDRLGLYRSLRP